MEHLWAPWRMAYIDSMEDGRPKPCIFCLPPARAGEDADRLVVHRSRRAFTMLNRFPYNPGHVMVASYRHGGDVGAMAAADLQAITAEMKLAVRVLQGALRCDGFNGGWNQGRIAGAGFEEHIHVHLVPRWAGDTNFMPVLADVKVLPEHLTETRAKLATAFAAAS